MDRINETLMVNIDLVSETEESVIEVLTNLGQERTVINIFRGTDAETIYKTLVNKKLISEHISQLDSLKNRGALELKLLDTPVKQPNPLVFKTFIWHDDARETLDILVSKFGLYDFVTLADYKKMFGITPYFADSMKGWPVDEFILATISIQDDGEYFIQVPEVRDLIKTEE